jgi:hypothetical protein
MILFAARFPVSTCDPCTLNICISANTTQVGVALFKDHPNALYPFSAMDDAQLAYVEGLVISCMNQHQQNVQRGQPNKNHHIAVHMQMGGGCVLHCTDQDPTAVRYTTSASTGDLRGAVNDSAQWTLARDRRKGLPANSNGGNKKAATSAEVEGCVLLEARKVLRALCDCVFSSRK